MFNLFKRKSKREIDLEATRDEKETTISSRTTDSEKPCMDQDGVSTAVVESGNIPEKKISIEKEESIEEEYKDTMNSIEELLFKPVREKFMKETIPKSPLSFRLNFVLNNTTSNPLAGLFPEDDKLTTVYEDDKINWDKVNQVLFGIPPIYGDYNINLPKSIHSRKEALKLRADIHCAEIIGGWREETCKDCGKKFYLTHGEVQYYLDRDLKLPKRCKDCRDKRKGNNTKPTHTSGLI